MDIADLVREQGGQNDANIKRISTKSRQTYSSHKQLQYGRRRRAGTK